MLCYILHKALDNTLEIHHFIKDNYVKATHSCFFQDVMFHQWLKTQAAYFQCGKNIKKKILKYNMCLDSIIEAINNYSMTHDKQVNEGSGYEMVKEENLIGMNTSIRDFIISKRDLYLRN